MEAVYYAARAHLQRKLSPTSALDAPPMSPGDGHVSQWDRHMEKRLLPAPKGDEQVLHGFSRAPHHPLPRLDQQVVDRVVEMRDDRAFGLGRTPGPKAMLYSSSSG